MRHFWSPVFCVLLVNSGLRADPPANTGDQVAEPPGAQYAVDTEISADLGECCANHLMRAWMRG
jgi:hypothetical protein